MELDSHGAVVWREFLNGFNWAGTRLGDVQFAWKGDCKVPLDCGANFEGVTNVVGYSGANATLLPQSQPQGPLLSPGTGLTPEGCPVDFGTSFLMMMEFTSEGPKANAALSSACAGCG